MKYWPLTVHAEIEFESFPVDPSPWWRPFLWWNFDGCIIVRGGALGIHLCFAVHWYGDLDTREMTPQNTPEDLQ